MIFIQLSCSADPPTRSVDGRVTAFFNEMKRNYGQTATRVALAAIFCFTLAVGQQLQFNGSSYKQNATLHDDLDMYWTVDTETDTFRVALRVKTSSGWAGIGFSEMGGMEGSDIVYYETAVGASRLAAPIRV